MTCVVGMAHEGHVTVGADSASADGWTITVRADEKVFRNGPFIMGFTTSWRMGQLLRHRLNAPERSPSQSVEHFMCVTFIDAVRQCLADGGWKTIKDNVDRGGTFLVGYEGRLFKIDSDFQVGEPASGYDACGCGEAFALGAVTASIELAPKLVPAERVLIGLAAAELHSGGVVGPHKVETL